MVADAVGDSMVVVDHRIHLLLRTEAHRIVDLDGRPVVVADRRRVVVGRNRHMGRMPVVAAVVEGQRAVVPVGTRKLLG